MAHVTLDLVDVEYPVIADHYLSLRRALMRMATHGKAYTQDTATESIHALSGINLTLQDGDRLGIVGRNGAGKTTLLRTIAGALLPVHGRREVKGHITALLGIGGGMDGNRTGYENIFFMGHLLGIKPRSMQHHVADIESFTELGNFLKLPVRTYSDGMKLRLSFAIVTCIAPDILVMDEAIGAGDMHFINKARARAEALYSRANILVMASHSTQLLKEWCSQAIWLENGSIRMAGRIDEIMECYSRAEA